MFGRMGQKLEARINQHILANVWKVNLNNLHRCVNTNGLAIAENFIKQSLMCLVL